MAVSNAMFLFEVVIDNVQSYVESRSFIIRSEFADIFSLELKDPKQMHIVIPEPPPLPPEPPGKKGKKKPPKPKKGKKGKGKVEEPPPEPCIQSGQSVLFTSSAEFLIQNMRKFPMELSLWSKEDSLVYIGGTPINWDPMFFTYLEKICNCQDAKPVTLKEEFNIFEEGTAKIMAKLGIQIKLTYLTDKVTTSFRTLSEDPAVKKVLYTGINSKTTSYMCTLKTTDEDFEKNSIKVENNYTVDKPRPVVQYASYKNAPAANLTFFNEGDYCCMKHADKPPESIYKSPECCPDIDFIVDYVRKIIVSCNDNMRMLTPRPTISPRIKATDIDRLCYCKETAWPTGDIADRFKKEVLSGPCPLCVDADKKGMMNRGAIFDIANIRGPCGKPDCRIARDMRAYIENLVEEDNVEFKINDVIGPCGSKECTVAEKIQEFLRHEGTFIEGATKEGLSTQCDCIQKMKAAVTKKNSCTSICSKECDTSDHDASQCDGKECPLWQKIYNVYYFTVEYEFDKNSKGNTTPSSAKSSKFKFCSLDTCPNLKEPESCSKSACPSTPDTEQEKDVKCLMPVCPDKRAYPLSPTDSNIIVGFDDIHRPCCVKTCDVADKVKDLIVDGVMSKKDKKSTEDNPCYCDCVCSFKFTKNTTYCAVCGGYECLGDDMQNAPEYTKPHPCPVYNKLYDKTFIRVQSPWPDDDTNKQETFSTKSSKTVSKSGSPQGERKLSRTRSGKSVADRKSDKKEVSDEKVKKQKNVKQEKKTIGKFTAVVEETKRLSTQIEKKPQTKYPYPPVPKNMGWNWVAEDIPGLKPRAKWRPGAANKLLVRRYRAVREGVDTIAKKKRALLQRKKKIEMKPTLTITKHDGEYTVQMEVFKKYSKERLLFQYPYDDAKQPLVYTIGKTKEEKMKIQRQRDRRERRETRRKSRLLQSTFKDKCQEICLKAYNQAIGLLPLPNPNSPDCPCQTKSVGIISPPVDSCSCSEEGAVSSSDTDNDEWVIEFTPPAAKWDAKAKHPPIFADNESQYTYLDYKVKILDKSGNQVVRYFKGPDGKQECSDLGGFWGPGHVWLEINKDGFIGPDNRWIPMNFVGPDGLLYTAEEGFFTDNTGQRLKIGVDGYIDKDGKWAWYSKNRRGLSGATVEAGKKGTNLAKTVSPDQKAKDGKNLQSKDKATAPEHHQAKGKAISEKGAKAVEMKKTVSYSSGKVKNPVVMSVFLNNNEICNLPQYSIQQPKSLRYIDRKKLAKYREIMHDLQIYEDLGEIKLPTQANRASNTPRKKVSPFTMRGAIGHYDKNTHSLSNIRSLANRSSTSSKSGTPMR